jgi:hypothetical protein
LFPIEGTGNGTTGEAGGGQLMIEAMLTERAIIHVTSPYSALSETGRANGFVAAAFPPSSSGSVLPSSSPGDYLSEMIQCACKQSVHISSVAAEVADAIVQDLQVDNHLRAPMLLLTVTNIFDISSDIVEPRGPSKGDTYLYHRQQQVAKSCKRSMPVFGINVSMLYQRAHRLSRWGFIGVSADSVAPESESSAGWVVFAPLPTALHYSALRSAPRRGIPHQHEFWVSAEEQQPVAFSVANEYQLVQMLRALGKSRSGAAVDVSHDCVMRREADGLTQNEDSDHPVQLRIVSNGRDNDGVQLLWKPYSQVLTPPDGSPTTSVVVTDTSLIESSSSYDFSHCYSLVINIRSIAKIDVRAGSVLIVSIALDDGQCATVERPLSDICEGAPLSVFLTRADIANGLSRVIRIGLHEVFAGGEVIRTVGERDLAMADLVPNCLLTTTTALEESVKTRSSDRKRENSIFLNMPTAHSVGMVAPRHAIT